MKFCSQVWALIAEIRLNCLFIFQKANLATTNSPKESPNHVTIPINNSLSSSTTSLNKKAAKLKDMLNCSRSRSSTNGASTSNLTPRNSSTPPSNIHSETCSLDLDVDVFSSTDDLTEDRGIEFQASRDKKKKSPVNQTITWLNKKIPNSPRRQINESRQASDSQVLTPAVLVDGAPTTDYSYLTPTMCNNNDKEQKSSTLSKLIRKPPDCSNRKRPKESPLKAMYEATVRANRAYDASTRWRNQWRKHSWWCQVLKVTQTREIINQFVSKAFLNLDMEKISNNSNGNTYKGDASTARSFRLI